jgi:hypothetical protein
VLVALSKNTFTLSGDADGDDSSALIVLSAILLTISPIPICIFYLDNGSWINYNQRMRFIRGAGGGGGGEGAIEHSKKKNDQGYMDFNFDLKLKFEL